MQRLAYDEMNNNESIHWWFVGRRSILKNVLDNYYQDSRKNVLEVGCGSGGNLHMLKAYGEISAMELDDESRAVANSRKICNVMKGKLPDDIPFDSGFDLVCMLDVLEHIDDDLAALHAIKKYLNINGELFITVPAYKFMWGRQDEASGHKRRYTKKLLTDVISEAGLSVKYATYFNTFLFPAIAAARILNKIIGNKSGSDISLPSKPVNNILKGIFSSENWFLPGIQFPFGVSILLIAEQKEDI